MNIRVWDNSEFGRTEYRDVETTLDAVGNLIVHEADSLQQMAGETFNAKEIAIYAVGHWAKVERFEDEPKGRPLAPGERIYSYGGREVARGSDEVDEMRYNARPSQVVTCQKCGMAFNINGGNCRCAPATTLAE